ncbi:hypothetical protein BPOR_0321g00110 [Botrytis porri]|uniref:AB hydrolase-1 domain-containing protein n=1 Tax=Botrytis porri TaxID=87229 RepID=A0A4Z1KPH7_9HELO|nr:hypothetical protein BPOR_0321g00110 [Botrytis porri]
MVNSKPTVVFIPGFWHTPEGFTPLAKLLDKEGYPPVLVNLPSAGAHPGHPDFSQDVAAICKIVTELSNEGKEVLVVMHSGESVSGSEATRNLGKKERQADRKNGGIVRVIYIGILLPKAGKTMFETFQGVVSSSDIDPNFVVDQDQSFHVFAEQARKSSARPLYRPEHSSGVSLGANGFSGSILRDILQGIVGLGSRGGLAPLLKQVDTLKAALKHGNRAVLKSEQDN